MARRVVARIAVAVIIAVGASASAQQVFRASTDLVLLSVSAARGSQTSVGLDRADFRIFEDGRPQDIAVFERDPRPIALSILMDASSSMEPKLGIAQDAAIEFCRRLKPDDIAQFVAFNVTSEVRQPFTNDVALLEKAIRGTRLANQTSLYTAMYVALTDLQAVKALPDGMPRRKALILVSDGEDTSSLLPYDEVVERAKRTDVTVFAIAFRPSQSTGFSEYNYALRAMAQTTGGRVFFVEKAEELPAIYNAIADELANQYTIGYISKNGAKDGSWRNVTVRVSQPGVVARTREGYYAPAAPKVR
jgi:Ca-activated chloride channel homolog